MAQELIKEDCPDTGRSLQEIEDDLISRINEADLHGNKNLSEDLRWALDSVRGRRLL